MFWVHTNDISSGGVSVIYDSDSLRVVPVGYGG